MLSPMLQMLAVGTLALATPAQAAVYPENERPIIVGTSYTIASAALADARQVNVWLPDGYAASGRRYPVVYLLDGATDQDFAHIAGLASLASPIWTFGPFILVGAQTRNRGADLTPAATDPRYRSAFPGSGGAPAFRRFLRQEVIPFVKGRFRTDGNRTLMGESLAGLFVVDTLLAESSLFTNYVAIDPSLWWDDRRPLYASLATRLQGQSGKRLFLCMANEGGTMQDGVDRLRRALAALPAGRVQVRYADYGKVATHATVYHHAAEDALRWLYPAPAYDDGPTAWFIVDGASPPPATQPTTH